MLIRGNADERGSREYDVGLGQRRSDSVKKMLLLLGANEHTEDCWWKNRRGDIRYSGEY